MGWHQAKKLLHCRRSDKEEAANRKGENICNYTIGKGLLYRIRKELKKLNSNTTNNAVKKCAKGINRHF